MIARGKIILALVALGLAGMGVYQGMRHHETGTRGPAASVVTTKPVSPTATPAKSANGASDDTTPIAGNPLLILNSFLLFLNSHLRLL